MSYSRALLRTLVVLFSCTILNQQAHTQPDVIMQGFYWNTNPGDITTNDGIWWDSIATVAEELGDAGFSTLWTPPPTKGFAGIFDMGYGTYDYFDLGEFDQKGTIRTRHGNRAQLDAMITALHAQGIEVIVDIVLNHRAGAENQQPEDCDDGDGQQLRFTDFDAASGRLPMNATDFHPNAFPGHCNLFGPYHDRTFFEDVCYFNFLDQILDPSAANDGWYFGPHNLGATGDSLIIWGRYLLDEVGFDAVRLDAVKHIEPGFLAPFIVELQNGSQPFAIGEFFDGNAGAVASYQQQVEQFVSTFGIGSKDANMAVFDFPLRFTLRDMANDLGGGFDMWNLNFRGLLLDGAAGLDGDDIVTFIENHDTDRGGWVVVECPGDIQVGNTCLDFQFDGGHDPVVFDKHMAYAYIMAAEGRPTVFWKDWFWYNLDDEIRWQMALRSATATGSTTPVSGLDPFSSDGVIGNDLFALRRDGSGSGDGAILMLNDNPGATYSFFLDSPAGWAEGEARDYSDAFMFETTQVFADGRGQYKCGPRNYAWYAPTGQYPQTPGEESSAFTLGDHTGAKLHYVVLRASDAASLQVNGAPIEPGDQVAIVPAGETAAVGLGRIGQSFTWDGVHDMLIEVLGGSSAAEAKGGLLNGEAFDVVVWDKSAGAATVITSITYAAPGTKFDFSASRPASRGGSTPFPITTTHDAGTYLTEGISLITSLDAETFVCEGSSAQDAAYDDGWQSGDTDGDGFAPWMLSTQNNNPGTGGHFVFTSTQNGDGDNNGDGDIDSGGRAWGMYANSGDVSNAVRPLTNPLTTGGTLSFDMDNGWIEPGGTVGFGLQNGSEENLFELFFRGGQANYEFVDAGGLQAIAGAGFSDEGLHFTFELTGADTYTATLTRLADGSSFNFGGSLSGVAGSIEISQVRFFNANAGFDSQRNAYFNSLEVCAPICTVTDPDTTYADATSCDPEDAGVSQELHMNQYGCDSLVITTTTLLPSDTTYLDDASCAPEDVGVEEMLLVNQYGCDSLIITTTILLPGDTTYLDAMTCDPGEVGVTELLLVNQHGCDSLVITTTTLYPLPVVDIGTDCEVVYPAYPDSACVTLTATVAGGTAPFTYVWTSDTDADFLETTMSIEVCPEETTTYTVVVTDANGCTSSDVVEVVAVDIADKPGKVFICHTVNQTTLSIDVTSVPDHLGHGDQLGACGEAYPCPGGAPQMQQLRHQYGTSMRAGDLLLFPNPANSEVTVSFTAGSTGEAELVIYNLNGQVLHEEVITYINGMNFVVIEVGLLPEGLYIVQVRGVTLRYWAKFVKVGR